MKSFNLFKLQTIIRKGYRLSAMSRKLITRLSLIKGICIGFFLIMINIHASCQTTTYGYDKNGNRISRVLTVEPLDAGMQRSKSFINIPFEYAKETEEVKEENIVTDETTINIYPNPTTGIIKVELTNMSEESKVNLSLFNLNGAKLIDQKNLTTITDLDVSKYNDGIFILQIKAKGIYHNYKIVKKH